jgi:hypothetical protein
VVHRPARARTALKVRALLVSRAYIDLQPERSADKVLDHERKTDVRSESPQSYESSFHTRPFSTSHFKGPLMPGSWINPSLLSHQSFHLSPPSSNSRETVVNAALTRPRDGLVQDLVPIRAL